MVCNDDGIVCLGYEELRQILNNQHHPIEWISATRHKREMYAVRGSNGELDFKVGQNDFPGKLGLGARQAIQIADTSSLQERVFAE